MSGDMTKVFRQALAQDPEERPGTLMDFLLPLVDAYPLDPNARQRVNELFRHDDHAGDIVPLRRLRPAPTIPAEPAPGVSSTGKSSGAFASGARAVSQRPVPSYMSPSTVKIELEVESPTSTRPPGHDAGRSARSSGQDVSAMTLVKWFIGVLVFGQLFWWAYSYLQGNMGQGGH